MIARSANFGKTWWAYVVFTTKKVSAHDEKGLRS